MCVWVCVSVKDIVGNLVGYWNKVFICQLLIYVMLASSMYNLRWYDYWNASEVYFVVSVVVTSWLTLFIKQVTTRNQPGTTRNQPKPARNQAQPHWTTQNIPSAIKPFRNRQKNRLKLLYAWKLERQHWFGVNWRIYPCGGLLRPKKGWNLKGKIIGEYIFNLFIIGLCILSDLQQNLFINTLKASIKV